MPIGELVVSIIGDMSKLSGVFTNAASEVGTFGSKMSSIGQTMSSTGSAMASGITVPLVAVGAGIGTTMSKATEFDTGMRRVATMLPGITQSGFQNISNQALTLSKDFGSSTSDMTNAMYQALSSGVPQDNIFTFMQDAEKLAIGGSTDVVTATDVLTNAVNSYGSANLSTAQASDILFQGTKFGKSTVEELAGSLSNVVPVAASMGVSFADVNASLATMTIQGTPTAQATTQLRAIMDELSDPTTKASMAFKEMSGKSFPDFIKAGGTVGGAIDILNKGVGKTVPDMKLLAAAEEELKNPTSAMATNFQKVSGKSFPDFIKGGGTVTQALDMMGVKYGTTTTSLKDYFGRVEAGTGALQLSGQGQKLYAQALDGTTKALGSTDKAYKTMADGSGASLDRLKSSFEVLMIKIGDAFLPLLSKTLVPSMGTLVTVIEKALPAIKFVADAFGSLPAPVQLVILAFIAFVAALGPVLMIAGSIATGIGAVAALFASGGALATAIGFISATVLPMLSAAFGVIVYTVIPIVVEALGLLISPVGLIAVAIVGLYLAWQNNWFGIRDVLAGVVTELSNDWTKITTELGKLPGIVSASLHTLYTIFSSGLLEIYYYVHDWGGWLLLVMGDAISNLKTATVAKLTELKNATVAKFNELIASTQTWISNQVAKFNLYLTNLNTWKTQQIAGLTELKTQFVAKLNEILTSTQTWISNQLAKFNVYVTNLNTWKTQQIAKLTELKTAFVAKLNEILAATQTWISNQVAKFNAAVSAANDLKTKFVAAFENMLSNVRTKVSDIVNAVAELPSKIKSVATDAYNAGVSIVQGLLDGLNSKLSAVKDVANKITSTVSSYLPHSPAKEGAFKKLPNWDAVFYTPLTESISKMSSLSIPLSNALSNLKVPIDSNLSAGLRSVSNISNSTNYGGDTYTIGPNTISNGVDLQTIIQEIERITANKRMAKGIYL